MELGRDVHQEEDHTAEAQKGTCQGHDGASHGFGFDDVRFSATVAVARVLQNFLLCSFPFTTGTEDKRTQKNHRYRPKLFNH